MNVLLFLRSSNSKQLSNAAVYVLQDMTQNNCLNITLNICKVMFDICDISPSYVHRNDAILFKILKEKNV